MRVIECHLVGWCGLLILSLGFGLSGCGRDPGHSPVTEPPIDFAALERNAELGDAEAQRILGEAYAAGVHVVPNYPAAAKWLRASAGQGNAAAQCALGQLFEAGQGVEQSYARARHWFEKAAEQDHVGAQYSLAVLYAFGRGVPVDDQKAAEWYLAAAKGGEALAQYNIGQRYAAGRGVPVDLVEACIWLALASSEIPDAATVMGPLERQLTRAQLNEVKRRVQAFAPQKSTG